MKAMLLKPVTPVVAADIALGRPPEPLQHIRSTAADDINISIHAYFDISIIDVEDIGDLERVQDIPVTGSFSAIRSSSATSSGT